MKKLIAITAATAALFSTAPAFASAESDFEKAMSNPIYSANAKIDMTMRFDKLGEALLETMEDGFSFDQDFMAMNGDMAIVSNEDQNVMQAAMNYTINYIYEEPGKMETYIDMDLRDEENPVIRQIAGMLDETGKITYAVTDMSSMGAEMAALIKASTESKLENPLGVEIGDKKPEYQDGKYRITLSDEDINTMFRSIFTGLDLSDMADANTLNMIPDFSKIPLFGKDALTLTVSLTEDKQYIQDMDMIIKLDTNMYDFLTAAYASMPDYDTAELDDVLDGLTKENSDFAMTINMSIAYSDINGDVKVNLPELTEENSYEVKMPEKKTLEIPLETQDDIEFMPLRAFCNAVGMPDEDILWDNGTITLHKDNGAVDTTIVLTIGSSAIECRHDESKVTFDLESAPYLKSDTTYVPVSFGEVIGNYAIPTDTENGRALTVYVY